ncbi:DUF1641 domain-containing protein [Halapricum hydrolyticum]|uniref:DUF1641 domain-containing protein n=1 Tax=Halapricum hydrolyticum TaxID=2979991 RepID=A0AAE3ICJ6_9EURY|nr:DUF1641 domain-containing protein [Halapricum hydrolyticum]MCU4718697.1 DUF1641 domain-containing protein [Halapricum hydrolyticum]MCU4727617.1 DUF1641 domain-containing protein [Halapricum hydrolyticum]
MSETESTQTPDDFETLIEENPEAVANLLERLDEEGTDVAALLNGSSGEASVDLEAPGQSPLSDSIDGNEEELAEGLESLAQIQRTGTLDDLLELSQVASLLMGAMDDEMVMSLSNLGSELGGVADTAAEEDVSRGLEGVLHAVGDVSEEEPEPVGAIGFAKALRDPEVKAGLGVALALVKALGRNVGNTEDA